jgi:4-hydroxybenzoate polyprenyltransferase
MHLFELNYFLEALSGFLIFCLASSAIYVINDLVDIEADRAHPEKKERPLPAGDISKTTAVVTASILLILVFSLMMNFNLKFILMVVAFVILNILYSFWFKNIVLLDVFSIAGGFTIRVLAGAFVILVPISSWLILTTMFISLFLGVMKRRSELAMVNQNLKTSADLTEQKGANSRKVLSQYSLNFADQMATIAATGVIVCYALYSVAPRTVNVFNTERLIYTTPFVVFGIFRFMYLEYISGKGENTTRTLATDLPMIINILLYVAATIVVIYKLI